MKINIDVQNLCCKPQDVRGIQIYTIEIIRALITYDEDNTYTLSLFDYEHERGNKKLCETNLGEYICSKVDIYECEDYSYARILESLDENTYNYPSYKEMIGVEADVFFFPTAQIIPPNVGGPIVATIHDIMPLLPFFTYIGASDVHTKRLEASLIRVQDKKDVLLVADSISTQRDVLSKYSIDIKNTLVVPLAVSSAIREIEDKNVLEKYDIRKKFFVYVGGVEKRKGICELIDAFNRMNCEDVDMVIAGKIDPSFVDIKKDFKDNIKFVGSISDYEKCVLISMAMIFVFPSYYEGFGLPVLEAMACGTAVITTDVGSLPEVGGDAVIYVKPMQIESLSRAMKQIYTDDNMRKRKAISGKERSKEFCWENVVDKMTRFFNKAYENR